MKRTTGNDKQGENQNENPSEDPKQEEPKIEGKGFKIIDNNLVCEPNITVQNIKSVVSTATIKDGNTNKTTGNLATGWKITAGEKTYSIVVKGDVNGDGKVSSADYVRIKNYILKKVNLTKEQESASDATGDGKTSSADYVRVKNYILKKANITI